MTAKTKLLEMFDADMTKASGYDLQDLQVVRTLIERTDDMEDPKAFMAAIRENWTLGEQDAYIRATEWKRRQPR